MATIEDRIDALETLVIMLLKKSRVLNACVTAQRQMLEQRGVFAADEFVALSAAIQLEADDVFAAEFADAQAEAHAGTLLQHLEDRANKPQ